MSMKVEQGERTDLVLLDVKQLRVLMVRVLESA